MKGAHPKYLNILDLVKINQTINSGSHCDTLPTNDHINEQTMMLKALLSIVLLKDCHKRFNTFE